MKYKNQNYPYPVLSPFSDDYVEDEFSFDIKAKNNIDYVEISIQFSLKSSYLNKIIEKGKAVFAVRIESSRSRYRKLYIFKEKNNKIEISSGSIEGKVKLTPFIICNRELNNYKSDNFHEDYGDRSYELNIGDIIAISNEREIITNKDRDPLRKVTSMFSFCLNDTKNAPAFDIDHSGDRIKIKLSKNNYKILQKLKRSEKLQYILSAKFIVPTLIHILYILESDNPGDYEEKRWYYVLKKQMDKLGYNIDNYENQSIVKLAQEIINDPVSESMNVLDQQLIRGDFSE